MSCCGGPKWKREVVPDHKVRFSSPLTPWLTATHPVWFYQRPWIHRQWIYDAHEVVPCLFLKFASLTPSQVPMGLPHRVEVLPRLRFRYLFCHYHVNHPKLVKRNLQAVWLHRWLCFHSFQHREMAFCWLYHCLVSSGASLSYLLSMHT